MKAVMSHLQPASRPRDQREDTHGTPEHPEGECQGHEDETSELQQSRINHEYKSLDAPQTKLSPSSPVSPPCESNGSNRSISQGGSSKAKSGSVTSSQSRSLGNQSSTTNLSSYNSSRHLSDSAVINRIRNDVMISSLYAQQKRKLYLDPHNSSEGVVLKTARDSFVCYPKEMSTVPDSLYEMAAHMNICCAMTVNTLVVRSILLSLPKETNSAHSVPLANGLQLQILETMSDLRKAQLHQFSAFIMDTQLLVVWDDDPENLVQRAQNLEMLLVQALWDYDCNDMDEKAPQDMDVYINEVDVEDGTMRENRPIQLQSSLLVGIALTLSIVCLGLGWRSLALQTTVDGNYTRFVFIILSPVYWFISLFFFQALVGNLFRVFAPIACVSSNSKCYSGKPPTRLDRAKERFPHITIQMPVYKEGLEAVIKPTVISLKAAISTYEMQGGTANIFVNDDGMQLIAKADADARREFYREHNIGWVARPAHSPKPEMGKNVFLRRGKFKKASNMNYALRTSNLVEERLATIVRGETWSDEDEMNAYYQCLSDVVEDDGGRTWSEGFIRIGDYILIIDSDTRIPADCLLDAASEMEYSPEVAIIQFSSGVMNVTTSFFEKGITWFTNLIYSAITFAVASGDTCPFVGHNAILRWEAIQDAAAYHDDDGYEKYWSESHVSEDFDMALRMQAAGYVLRYAAYMGDGFREGVSLTVYDELARWEKYAYGCNELMFHPFRLWIIKGPITPLFRRFLSSSMPLPNKLTIVAYIGTYYALALGWLFTLINYFLTGWFWGYFDKFYIDSFAIYVSVIVVFTGLGNVTLSILQYRLGQKSLIGALLENIKWIPMFTVFIGGLSIHLSQAVLAHFFESDMAWGATAKEIEANNFGYETLRILRRFKFTFVYCFASSALMIIGFYAFPIQWRIVDFSSIFPMAMIVSCHFALPVLLNPGLMRLTW